MVHFFVVEQNRIGVWCLGHRLPSRLSSTEFCVDFRRRRSSEGSSGWLSHA